LSESGKSKEIPEMRLVTRLAGLCAVFASLFVGVAGAGTLVLTFPESSNTPSFSSPARSRNRRSTSER
jgi:hypothetical protein